MMKNSTRPPLFLIMLILGVIGVIALFWMFLQSADTPGVQPLQQTQAPPMMIVDNAADVPDARYTTSRIDAVAPAADGMDKANHGASTADAMDQVEYGVPSADEKGKVETGAPAESTQIRSLRSILETPFHDEAGMKEVIALLRSRTLNPEEIKIVILVLGEELIANFKGAELWAMMGVLFEDLGTPLSSLTDFSVATILASELERAYSNVPAELERLLAIGWESSVKGRHPCLDYLLIFASSGLDAGIASRFADRGWAILKEAQSKQDEHPGQLQIFNHMLAQIGNMSQSLPPMMDNFSALYDDREGVFRFNLAQGIASYLRRVSRNQAEPLSTSDMARLGGIMDQLIIDDSRPGVSDPQNGHNVAACLVLAVAGASEEMLATLEICRRMELLKNFLMAHARWNVENSTAYERLLNACGEWPR